jgi:hypothetical protein
MKRQRGMLEGENVSQSVLDSMFHELFEVGADRGKLPTSALPPTLAQTAKCAIG